jgi:hypothetical protein
MATVTTTWTSPASATLDKATGATIDETMTDAWSSNLYALGGTVGYIGARVFNSANLSITNATDTALTFNSETFDSDPNGAIHDTASAQARLTIRTAGLYLFVAGVSFATNATGYRQVYLRVNGTAVLASVTCPAVSASVQTDIVVTAVNTMAATDFCEVIVVQTSGGALNVQALNYYSPYFMCAKV